MILSVTTNHVDANIHFFNDAIKVDATVLSISFGGKTALDFSTWASDGFDSVPESDRTWSQCFSCSASDV